MVYVYKSKEVSNISLKKIFFRSSLVILLALGLGFLTKKFLFFAHKVQTSSMHPSIKKDEIVYFSRIFGKLDYNSIVLAYTQNPKRVFLARVVGLEGDKISIKNKKVFRNGKPIEINSILTDKRSSFPQEISKRDNLEKIQVGKGECFLICENQDECIDSRDVGGIKLSNIIGKKIF